MLASEATQPRAASPAAGTEGTAIPVIPLRHPGRWIGTAILALFVLFVLRELLANENLGWDVVAKYFFSTAILTGLLRTIELTVLAMAGGIALGILLAVMRLSDNPAFAGASSLFVLFFRGVPPLVQLVFWFNLATLTPKLTIGIPYLYPVWSVDTNTVMTPYLASVIGLILIEAAYAAEIIRAGITSIDPGQRNAARSLGMSPVLTFRRIVLPQALRLIVPPLGNDAISMLKTTSLVSVIALPELLYSAQIIYARNYQVIPLLIVASLWYLIMTAVLSLAQRAIERRLGKGTGAATSPGLLASLRTFGRKG